MGIDDEVVEQYERLRSAWIERGFDDAPGPSALTDREVRSRLREVWGWPEVPADVVAWFVCLDRWRPPLEPFVLRFTNALKGGWVKPGTVEPGLAAFGTSIRRPRRPGAAREGP